MVSQTNPDQIDFNAAWLCEQIVIDLSMLLDSSAPHIKIAKSLIISVGIAATVEGVCALTDAFLVKKEYVYLFWNRTQSTQ